MKLNTLIYFFVILNISEQADDSFDFYSRDLYIREGDQYKLNMNKYLSLYSSSINFSSNNQKVKLPGLLPINPEIILPKIPFNTHEFKAKNNHFFILENDKKTFYDIHFNEDQEYIEIDSEVKRYLIVNEKIGCNDIMVVEDRVFLLCFDIKEHSKMDKKGKIEYRIVFYDYFKNLLEGSVKFNSIWMSNPKFKLLNINNERFFEKETTANFALFDKEINSESYDTKKAFFFVNVKLKQSEDSNFKISGIKQKGFENLLFGGSPTKLKIENIIFSDEGKQKSLFFVVKKEEKGKKLGFVYKCILNKNQNVAETKLSECEHFMDTPIVNFFKKNDYIIYTTTKNQMFFCVKNIDNCKNGKIQSDWNIEKILLEDTKAVVIMSIKKNYIMFMNNFETNQFTWVYEKMKDLKDFRLFRSYEQNENKYFLLNFYEKGFGKRDITFQNKLEINTSMFKEFEPISLFLENNEIFKLNVKPWGGERLVDLNEDHRYHVVKTDSDKYKLRLGWAGNNLNFENNEEVFIYYYNTNDAKIFSKTLKKVGNVEFYNDPQDHKLYIFHNNGIIINTCTFVPKKITTEFFCRETKTFEYKERDINNLLKITRVGNYLLLDDKDIDKTNFYDVLENKIVEIIKPENIKGYNSCTSAGNRFYCSYTDQETKTDYLRFFRFSGNKLTEIESLSGDFKLILEELKDNNKRNELTEIRIKNYKFDTNDKRRLYIQFHMIYNTNLENVFYKLTTRRDKKNNFIIKETNRLVDFEKNADIKRNSQMYIMDSQVLFLSIEPKFKLFCYQDDSYFVFEYIDVKKIMETKSLSSGNKFAIVYQSHQNDKYYYAIFDIRQNAVRQLLRNEEIPHFKESMKIYLMKLDETRLLITLMDMEKKEIVFSYIYFNKGPLMISNEISNGVLINDNIYDIQAIEDNTFNLSEYRYKKTDDIIIKKDTKPFTINFEDYVSIKGNLKIIDIRSDMYGDSASIDVPLMLEKTEHVNKVENRYLFVKTFGKNVVYQTKTGNEFYIDTDKKTGIKIQLGFNENTKCEEIALSSESLICLWIKESFYYISAKSFKNPEKSEEIFEISSNGDQLQILEDNSSFLTIVLCGISRHKVSIYRFDRLAKINRNNYVLKNISKKTLVTENLRITKYYSFLNTQTSIITVIIFDAENNRLYIYHSDIKGFVNKKILRKNINLNFLEPLFDKVACEEKEINIHDFKCTFYSSSRIYVMEIKKSFDVNISDFTWEYSVLSEYHNVLYPNSFHYDYNLRSVEHDDYIFMVDSNFETENLIVVYKANKDHPYSYFILKMDGHISLKSFLVVDDKLIIYYVSKSKLIKDIYFIKDYRLNILKPKDFMSKDFMDGKINFYAQFLNSNNYNLHLDFTHPEIVEKEVQKKGKGLLIFLIVSIVIVSLLILSAILTMIMLIKQRKKDTNINMTMNDTLNDPSFRISTIE